MHWARKDSSFNEDDYGVFSFESRASTVVEYRYDKEVRGSKPNPRPSQLCMDSQSLIAVSRPGISIAMLSETENKGSMGFVAS